MYEIFEKNESGEWVPVDVGGVESAKTGREQARQARQQEPKKKEARANKAAQSLGGNTPARERVRSPRRDPTKIKEAIEQRSRTGLTPLQQRINEAKMIAYQQIADKKARGE